MMILLYYIDIQEFSLISRNQFWKWLGFIFLTTVLFPFLAILVLRLAGSISDAFMHLPKDRILPLTSTLLFYSWAFYFFEFKALVPLLMRTLLLGAIFSIMIDLVINFFYKVSVHTTAAAMMPGIILTIMIIDPSMPVSILISVIFAAALVGWVRWWLGAHTIGQIFLGYSIGTSMQLIAWLILGSA